jgi:hypothetical protein
LGIKAPCLLCRELQLGVAFAANDRNPPFVSKSAWRSNLTGSLSHNYRERPIADIDRGSRRCAAAFALLPFVYGAAYFLLESSVSGRGRPIPPNNH